MMRNSSARFSIAGLIAVVGLFGIGFAALASPSALWAGAVVSLNLAMLVVALIAAIERRDPVRRAFWTGFLIAGGIYLIAARGGWLDAGNELVTTAALDILYAQIAPPAPSGGMGGMGGGSGMMGGFMGGGFPGGMSGNSTGMGMGMSMGSMMPGMGGPAPTTRWREWARPNRTTVQSVGPGFPQVSWVVPRTFLHIGHSIFSLIFGIMGGFLARWYRRDGGAHHGEPIG